MATKTINQFTAITSIESADEILAWDASAGTTRKITFANFQTGYLAATGATTGATSQAQTFTNGILVGNGAVGTPSVAFSSDTNTGLYRIGADTLGLAVGGARAGSFGLSGSNRECRVGDGSNVVKLYVDGGSTNTRDLVFMTAGSSRWLYRVNDTPESGANAGSDFVIIGRADDGSSLGNYFFINRATGYTAIGNNTSPTAVLDLVQSTTARASLRIRGGTRPTTPNTGDIWDDGALVTYQTNATTNAVVNSLKLERGSSGTPAAGFGLGILAQLESSTTETQDAGRLTWAWSTATHASRAAVGKLTAYYTSTEREAITWTADSSSAKVGINTSSPLLALHVSAGDSDGIVVDATSYPVYRWRSGGANKYEMYYHTVSDYLVFGVPSASTDMVLKSGKMGIGSVEPQALIHGHDGSGGFMFVNKTGVDGTLVTVIPNGTGDVTERLHMFGWVSNSVASFVAQVNETYLDVSSSTTKTDGSNTLTIAVAADGSFTLQATAGAATWKVLLWVFWR